MKLEKSKKKIENGWIYRGFKLVKDGSFWVVSLELDENGKPIINNTDIIKDFISTNKKQVKNTCLEIDNIFGAENIIIEKSNKPMDLTIKESWNNFYINARTKKCNELFNSIFMNLKGLEFGEQKRNIDERGNITFYWLPINTLLDSSHKWNKHNKQAIEKLNFRYMDLAEITQISYLSFKVEITLNDTKLEQYVVSTTK